jgi:CHAT domain-containing protein
MVDLQVSLGRPDQALEYAESARSRALLESLTDLPGAHPIPVLATRSLQAGLPQHVALIEYQVLPTKLLTWVLRRDSIAVYQAEISQASLKLQVDQFRRKIQICSAALKGDAESRVLSALLIGKLKPALIGATALVIVPDGDLNAVPFSALPDGESGNYLVERYALSMAPSGRMYLSALAHKRHRVRALSLKVTAFGDPAFDRTLVDELVRLPKAKEEARKIASIYPRAKLSLDSEATRDQFFMALGNSDIVHFAGHAITNAKTPLASFLVLASAGADSGIVYASDLYKFRLSTSRLVVLSACSGLAGKDLGREGVESLARPFLAMGVPAVVASLWQVNDRPAGALLVEFHRRINGHASFGEALRKAQIAMLHSADLEFMSPAAWAGFQLIGAL